MNLWLGVGVLVLVALGVLLVPLWRATKARAPSLVDAGLPEDASRSVRRWLSLGLLVTLPAATAALYLYLGAPTILQEQALTQAHAAYDTDAMIQALEAKLRDKPDDAEGWFTLGRAYIVLQRPDDAERAFARASQLAPKEARMLSQQAEAIALKSGSLQGRPMELILQALDLDYEDEKALELAGLAAYQQQQWAQSLHFWRRLMKKLPKDSEAYEEIGRAVRIAERSKDPHLRAAAKTLLGGIHGLVGEFELAATTLREAIRLSEVVHDDRSRCFAWSDLLAVEYNLGHTDQVLALSELALGACERIDDVRLLTDVISSRGSSLSDKGRYAEAKVLLEDAVRRRELAYGPKDRRTSAMLSPAPVADISSITRVMVRCCASSAR